MKKIVNDGFGCPNRFACCKSTDSDPLVKNGLAITPRRLDELASQGIPISESTAASNNDFIDGYSDKTLDFEPPHIYQRHADMISAWNNQIDSRKQVSDYVNSQPSDSNSTDHE